MSVGKKIQAYRKQFNFSQEELGQKLLVSRQTVSLWEKDQTVPTVDNLMRLREIFGVSVDELLDIKPGEKEQKEECAPKPKAVETYLFNYQKSELNEIYRLQRRSLYKGPVLFTLACLFCAVISAGEPASSADFGLGLGVGALFIGLVFYFKNIRAYGKAWKKWIQSMCCSTYEYKLFSACLEVGVYRNGEKIRSFKYNYAAIEKIRPLKKWLLLFVDGQIFIIRKSNLKENSLIFGLERSFQISTVRQPAPNGLGVVSVFLFVASLLLLFGAPVLAALITNQNGIMFEKMWLLYLLTPIPIASIVLGFLLKAKGYKYKKNIVAGVIVTVFLCLYGTSAFLFSNLYNHSNAPVVKIEQLTGTDLPEPKQINTQNLKGVEQHRSGVGIELTSDIYFSRNGAKELENILAADDRWQASFQNDLVGITSFLSFYESCDYALIYNATTAEYNRLPEHSGTFHFISVVYNSKNQQLHMVEYNLNYAK